jgi:hypothetical protein
MRVHWPRLLAGSAVVATVLGAFAPGAWAGGTITPLRDRVDPIEHEVAGPAFAGKAVAYAVPVGRGYSVRIQQPDGTTSTHFVAAKGAGRLGEGEEVVDELAASPRVIALSHSDVTCGDEGCKPDGEPMVIENTVFAGAIGGALEFRGCSNYYAYPLEVDASGGSIAYLDPCANGAVVHDPTGPEKSSRAFPADFYAGEARIAGRYLAVDTRGFNLGEPSTTITVYDWQSGDVVYRIAGNFDPGRVDIQDDGTLAMRAQTGANAYEIYRPSPQDPVMHPVTGRSAPFEEVRIADDKIAVGSHGAFDVFALDGAKLATSPNRDSANSFGFDFDGERLAWVDQPCMVSAVVTWDMSGKAPTLPAGRCPAARAAGSLGVVDLKRRRAALPLRCPPKPALGCAGPWYAVLDSAPPVYTKDPYSALLPGEKRTVRLGLSRAAACRLGRTPATRATIDLTNVYGLRPRPEHGKARFKLRYIGRALGCK